MAEGAHDNMKSEPQNGNKITLAWLVDWLVDWLVGRLVSWLIGWLVG